jgi:thioredoxin 2
VSLSTPEPVSVDGAMFERLISRDTGPFVVDIWAPWCGPCRMMAPSYDQAADLMHDEVRFFKLNSDENQEASAKLNLRGIPTLIAYRGGQQKAVQPGAQMGQQLIDWVRHSVGR